MRWAHASFPSHRILKAYILSSVSLQPNCSRWLINALLKGMSCCRLVADDRRDTCAQRISTTRYILLLLGTSRWKEFPDRASGCERESQRS